MEKNSTKVSQSATIVLERAPEVLSAAGNLREAELWLVSGER
jgi:hypothetical protein